MKIEPVEENPANDVDKKSFADLNVLPSEEKKIVIHFE
jgi:hypothetical protein